MKDEELLKKIKDLVAKGNFEEAKVFFNQHKEQLGPYKEKAQKFLKDKNIQDYTEKLKNLFK
ncbi:hypothetical protein A5844_000212 [Enterococcus sp. 10A9_DIV0425]|uniref:Isoleucyl-tRNA synthetase n=1 Tax=Candidatus Enterococcus wittei TaxID=1987383 RepID=A0A2C9XQJ5_9ENTE|nr:hypothetical protein [Enterococcus sp. 10A9_DIV0425]OTP11997.1 hypothetical protein A5844_000212 [Enterococcus sp. 10A9_DIV0425]THE10684.1 hypothetical protein E1H99_09445 [Enterococcus hirae]